MCLIEVRRIEQDILITARFYINGKEYEAGKLGKYDFLQKEDTVLIKYSVEDPSVAEIVNVFYMQKYKHLKSTNN